MISSSLVHTFEPKTKISSTPKKKIHSLTLGQVLYEFQRE